MLVRLISEMQNSFGCQTKMMSIVINQIESFIILAVLHRSV